ncbi:hypothetical protein THAOC_05365 [Thalassiosira oceanica]|uniref:Uncharacterized protein n=1 Tax=Thalassiosira oceanica TaxID=159749 RepID=K0TH94_THAOC|nr:hypothetical protein THAOC_05365 [Thalassiosira oceanica]|eukprot:EJK73036.1 hypothetical protein THAOC_05365 [Thalassiosira oceanica]
MTSSRRLPADASDPPSPPAWSRPLLLLRRLLVMGVIFPLVALFLRSAVTPAMIRESSSADEEPESWDGMDRMWAFGGTYAGGPVSIAIGSTSLSSSVSEISDSELSDAYTASSGSSLWCLSGVTTLGRSDSGAGAAAPTLDFDSPEPALWVPPRSAPPGAVRRDHCVNVMIVLEELGIGCSALAAFEVLSTVRRE